jgi:hypothetical protein
VVVTLISAVHFEIYLISDATLLLVVLFFFVIAGFKRLFVDLSVEAFSIPFVVYSAR